MNFAMGDQRAFNDKRSEDVFKASGEAQQFSSGSNSLRQGNASANQDVHMTDESRPSRLSMGKAQSVQPHRKTYAEDMTKQSKSQDRNTVGATFPFPMKPHPRVLDSNRGTFVYLNL